MNENEMQDTALRNLLTQKLESDDMKMFIDSLNASKDDDSAIQELKKSYEAYISNESLSTGTLCLGRPACAIVRCQTTDSLPL